MAKPDPFDALTEGIKFGLHFAAVAVALVLTALVAVGLSYFALWLQKLTIPVLIPYTVEKLEYFLGAIDILLFVSYLFSGAWFLWRSGFRKFTSLMVGVKFGFHVAGAAVALVITALVAVGLAYFALGLRKLNTPVLIPDAVEPLGVLVFCVAVLLFVLTVIQEAWRFAKSLFQHG